MRSVVCTHGRSGSGFSHDRSPDCRLKTVQKRQRRRGGAVALYVEEQIDCTELCLRNSNEQVESLWVKVRGQANKGNLMADVYYRPPNQVEPVDKFLLQLWEASHSQPPILLGDFIWTSGICWKSSAASCMQSRRLLECVKDNLLIQVINSSIKKETLLDLFLLNMDELIIDVKTGGSLGCSDHALVESQS